MEEHFKNNSRNVFEEARKQKGRRSKSTPAIKDAQGKLEMEKQDILSMWRSHFERQ